MDAARFQELCRAAEEAGIDSLYVPGPLPESLALVAATALRVNRLRFRVGCDIDEDVLRLCAWKMPGSRLILHLAPRPAEMERAAAFIREYRVITEPSGACEIDIEGNSADAAFLVIKHADVLWRRQDTPAQVHADALPVRHFGKEVGLTGAIEELAGSLPELQAAGISQFLFEAPADFRFFERVRSLGCGLVHA